MRLIADIGGTNARFALLADGVLRDELLLRCDDFPTITAAIQHYLHGVGAVEAIQEAALAIAAPPTGDEISMTNHHWRFSVSALRAQMAWQRLIVLNDFTALALAIRHLPSHELQQVGGVAQRSTAPIALLGPGTGLGVSGLIHAAGQWVPLQGEGGHVSLAPGNEREAAVLKQLWHEFSHVSVERVLSGPGLINLYNALCTLAGQTRLPLSASDITTRALQQQCVYCEEALAMFCALLASVAGDLVLTLGATQGCYIGGGIVPRLGDYFAQSAFRQRFEDKGRYVEYLRGVPVYVIHTAMPTFTGLMQAFSTSSPRVEATA